MRAAWPFSAERLPPARSASPLAYPMRRRRTCRTELSVRRSSASVHVLGLQMQMHCLHNHLERPRNALGAPLPRQRAA